MRTMYVLVILALGLSISACEPTEGQLKAEELLENPSITKLGVYEGCEVKYVDRGFTENSFYIADCSGTSTTTSTYKVRHGRTYREERSTVITKEVERLQSEFKEAVIREAALAKLSEEDRKILGVK